jgi:alpha-glucosidase
MKKLRISILLLSIAFAACTGKTGEDRVTSPDGKISIDFELVNGVPNYNVLSGGDTLIRNSQLGVRLKDRTDLIDNFEIGGISAREYSEIWEPVWGENEEIENNYNELKVELVQNDELKRKLVLYFRAYNDGAAFRYEFPMQQSLDTLLITSEETQFNFTDDHSAWWIPDDYDSYEHLYSNTKLSEIQGVNTPVTFETGNGLFVSLHEAALTDYPGMTLAKKDGYSLKSELVPWPDGIKVKASLPHKSPWRTIQIGRTAGELIESNLILNLNEPTKFEDVSWIKPLKYVGIWWGMHIDKFTWHAGTKHGATTERTKDYIDFAATHNIDAVLVEGWNVGWESWLSGQNVQNYTKPYEDFDIEEVINYAKSKGIEIIGHHETGANIAPYEEQMEDAFKYYSDLGIKSIKTGYAGDMIPSDQYHHGQWMVNHYRSVVKLAEKHKITIDAHEPIKATGISRTYPNMMTREGVRGMEWNAWSDGNPPEHTTILPFTRYLAGPVDYTPGIFDIKFDDYKLKENVYSTVANQLALYVVLYSPMQMAADLIENYENKPAFEFIERVPVDWDKTEVLNAKIGDFVTIARKKGDNWYLGSITDENKRNLSIKLNFLDEGREYEAKIFADGKNADYEENPTEVSITTMKVDYNTELNLELARGGGQAVIFTQVNE